MWILLAKQALTSEIKEAVELSEQIDVLEEKITKNCNPNQVNEKCVDYAKTFMELYAARENIFATPGYEQMYENFLINLEAAETKNSEIENQIQLAKTVGYTGAGVFGAIFLASGFLGRRKE